MVAICAFLFGIFCSVSAFADRAPEWVSRKPHDTRSVRYYVGYGEGETKGKARAEAIRDAKMRVLETLGVFIETSAQTYDTLDTAEISEFSKTDAAGYLVGFDQLDVFDRKNGKIREAYVLYSYPRFEIEKERKRLEDIRKNGAKAEFSKIGDDRSKGVLRIDAGGVRAKVLIDGQFAGYAPIELIGQLEYGPHDVVVDDPKHELFSRRIVVAPNTLVAPPVRLKKAFAFISVSTDGVRADVRVNGKKAERAPLTRYKVPAGEEISVEAGGGETEKQSRTVTLERDEIKKIQFKLIEKKAKLSVYSSPSGAYVQIDGLETGLKTPLEGYSIDPGEHDVALFKNGYEQAKRNFVAPGGKSRSVSLNLKKMEQTGNLATDKAHSFTFFPSSLPFPSARDLSAAGAVNRLAAWNGAFPFVKARVSRKVKGGLNAENGFLVTVYFDETEFANGYVAPMRRALTHALEVEPKKENVDLICFDGGRCALDATGAERGVYLRAGKFKHSFFSDGAPFWRFDANADLYRTSNARPMQVYFAAFDKKGRAVAKQYFDFTLEGWKKVGKAVFFSPSMTTRGKKKCRLEKLFGGVKHYDCGAETLSFETKGFVGDIDRVFVSVGVMAK